MLEILIIICLAVAFFLVLRHYPDVIERKPASLKQPLWKRMRSFFAAKKKKQIEQIKRQINSIKPEVEEQKLPELAIQQKYYGLEPEMVRLLCAADEAFEANDLREAETKAIEAISKDKRCSDAYIIIGKIAFSRGEFDDSKQAYETALKCSENKADAYFGLAQIDLRSENYQDSIDNFSKALALEKGRADWYAEQGRAYTEIRQFAKAAKAFKKAAAIDIENKDYKDLASEAEDKQRAHASVARMK